MHSKKAQMSIFIAMAVLIILAVYVVINTQTGAGPERAIPSATLMEKLPDAEAVRAFVSTCVDTASRDALSSFGTDGGDAINRQFAPIIESGGYFIPLYYADGRVNIPSNDRIGRDILGEYVVRSLPNCLASMRVPGVTVRPARTQIGNNGINANAQIRSNDVQFVIDYPLIVEKGESQTIISDPYTSVVKVPLGQMLELSRKVVESHVAHPTLVDWPDIYATNTAGLYNFTYFFPVHGEEQVPNIVVYQLIANNARIGDETYRIFFGARFTE